MINLYTQVPVRLPAVPLKKTAKRATASLANLFLFFLTTFCFLVPTAQAQVGPADATLSSIKLTPGATLIGTTGPGYLNYTTTVAGSTSSVTVTATARNAGATLTVNGTPVVSGTASAPIAIAFGSNVITTAITSQDGKVHKSCIITVNRAPSTNAALSTIQLTPASTLISTTGPGYLNYKTTVAGTTSSIIITPTAQDAGATIKVNGSTVASGTASAPIALVFGSNVINITATAQDGTTTKSYIITATRTPSSNAGIATISLSPALTLVGASGPGYLNYTAAAANSTASVQITPTAQDAGATIKVNGTAVASGAASSPIALSVGSNTITTVITAQDGTTTKTIIITVNRAKSADAGLAGLGVSAGTLTPAFATATLKYTASVPYATTSVKVTPTTSDANATVTVNGLAVASGSASGNIALNVGANTIITKVTAQNGITTQTYTTTINRLGPPADASLASINLSPATTLTGTTGPGYLNFTASVAVGTPSIKVVPTATDPNATIRVNGTTVISGSASQAIALTTGSNVINTVITAQDGVTTRTVIITINTVPLPTVSYTGPNTYTVGTTIKPLAATSTGVTAMGFSSSPASLNPGVRGVNGVAVDAAGNIFVATNSNNSIMKIPAGGGPAVVFASGFSFPSDVAVDAAGNVYEADSNTGTVKEVLAGTNTPVTIASGIPFPAALALDAAGNIYVADGSSSIFKIAATDHALTTFATGFNSPFGVAVDNNNNVFVTDFTNSLFEIPANGGPLITINTGFNNNNGVRVDGAGNVYVADSGNGVVKIFAPGSTTPRVLNYKMDFPYGLAFDQAGNLYASDASTNLVYKFKPVGGYFISPNLPAGLSFNSNTGLISGTPTAVSPATNYTITGYNAGSGAAATVNIAVNLPPLPTVSYTGPNTYIVGTTIKPLATTGSGVAAMAFGTSPASLNPGVHGVNGVAVDAAGNVYVATNSNNSIMKIPVGGGPAVVFASGFSFPSDVAVDAAGNVYEADSNTGTVKEVLAGTNTPVTIASGIPFPAALALDAAGNIYVADGSSSIFKIAATGHALTTFATGFNSPFGVAVDNNNNVFVTDFTNSLFEIPANGGPRITINTGFNNNNGVRVDGAGNVYVADSGNGVVKIFPAGSTTPTVLNYQMSFPYGLAFDQAGDLYASDASTNLVYKFNPVGGYFISPNLPAGLSFNSKTGLISGTPTTVSPATSYTITGYNATGSAAATVNIAVNLPPLPTVSYTGPNTYIVGTTIKPLATTGSGVAAMAFGSSPTSLNPGATGLNGVAVDATGNIYMATNSNNSIMKIPVGGGPAVVFASGFSFPSDVAVDAAGNVYEADSGSGTVKEVLAGTNTPATIASGIPFPAALALDAAGNIYVADGSSSIFKIAATGHALTTFATGFNSPFGVAVDNNNNVFVTDFTNSLFEIPANGGPRITINTGFNNNNGVRVDGAGNVYVADSGNGVVKIFPAGSTTPTVLNYKMSFPYGLAFDQAGDLYASDASTNLVYKFNPVGGYFISPNLPAGLSFNGNTGLISGTPTAVSPATTYTVTGYNIAGGGAATVSIQVKANANLANLALSSGTLTPAFVPTTLDYIASVANAISTITITPTTADSSATVTVAGTAVASGSPSAAVALAAGSNNIAVVVTAVDGTTTQTYNLEIDRAAPPSEFAAYSVSKPVDNVSLNSDGIVVHQALSPNGDGVDDHLTIDNITSYPDNHLTIVDRNGNMVYEAKGYDNGSKVFDGRTANGKMQQPGTYFYSLNYTVKGETRNLTGFIILKY